MSLNIPEVFSIPWRDNKSQGWLECKNHPFCCDTWAATVMPSPTLMPTSLPRDTPIPTSMPSLTSATLTPGELASIPYFQANAHPRFADFLDCINQRKIVALPPGPITTGEAIIALEEASWMAYLGLRDGATLHMYLAPSNNRDGYMTEICRGDLQDGLRRCFPLTVDKFLKPQPSATIRLKCGKHSNKLQCWFLERKEPDIGV